MSSQGFLLHGREDSIVITADAQWGLLISGALTRNCQQQGLPWSVLQDRLCHVHALHMPAPHLLSSIAWSRERACTRWTHCPGFCSVLLHTAWGSHAHF